MSKLALAMQRINIPPMMNFKVAKVRISAWVTIPVGLATGMLAATIAVGGFIGVPGMIYVIGCSAVVASASELGIAFLMGLWGSIQWGLSGLIDIRLTLLILATSLIVVQLGAQSIKSQFAGMRLQDRQEAMASFARDVVALVAEIVAEHFSEDTIWDASGWEHTEEARALDKAAEVWQQKSYNFV